MADKEKAVADVPAGEKDAAVGDSPKVPGPNAPGPKMPALGSGSKWFVVEGCARCSWVLATNLEEAEVMVASVVGRGGFAKVGNPKPVPSDPREKRPRQRPRPGEQVVVAANAPKYSKKDNCTDRDRKLAESRIACLVTVPSGIYSKKPG